MDIRITALEGKLTLNATREVEHAYPEVYRSAALMLTLIRSGPWHEHELTDALDALVLMSRGHSLTTAAQAVTCSSGRLRGPGYIRSVRRRAAETLGNSSTDGRAA